MERYLEVLRRGLARAAQQARGYHYAAWGLDVLVDVHTLKLADVLPTFWVSSPAEADGVVYL